jgi:hypothetical protein
VHWLVPVLASGLVAAGGAAAAIAAGADDPEPSTIVALSPLRAAAPAPGRPAKLESWPRRNGYTIVLAALPTTTVRAKAARARALAAAGAGVLQVGVLDSSRYASLHPGYWIVFSGVYASEAEATSALEAARRFARTAAVRRVVP